MPTISFGQESENSAGGSIDQSHHHASRLHENSSPDFAKSGGVGVIGSGSVGSHRFKNSSQLALNRKQPMVSKHRRENSNATAKKRARKTTRAKINSDGLESAQVLPVRTVILLAAAAILPTLQFEGPTLSARRVISKISGRTISSTTPLEEKEKF